MYIPVCILSHGSGYIGICSVVEQAFNSEVDRSESNRNLGELPRCDKMDSRLPCGSR